MRRRRAAAPGRRRRTWPPPTPRASASPACASSPARLIGAALLLLSSAAATFAVNGATFLVGAALAAALPREALRRPAGAVERGRMPRSAPTSPPAGGRCASIADALPLVGAEIVSSSVYGALTVLFVLLGERLGLGAAGYGYLVSALRRRRRARGRPGHRAAASDRTRGPLLAAVAATGLALVLFAATGSVVVAVVLAAGVGAATLTTEVVADTALQRSLDPAVFARAYGLVVPACVAGIAGGALLAPACVALIGLDATLLVTGLLVLAYGALAFVRPAASARAQHLADAAVGVDGAADQLEALRLGQAVEERDPVAERDRVHGEPELVGEPLADQAVAEVAAAEDDDVLAALGLELPGSRPRSRRARSGCWSSRPRPASASR